ncbi:MAG: hypothetical protein AB1649_11160 [Chloroflexota bacterium]
MTKLDSNPPPMTYAPASVPGLEPARRLIVLVPAEADTSAAAHRVWELANAMESSVQLIGMCNDVVQEFSLRRQLVTVSAMVQDDKIHAEARLEIGSDWVMAVKSDLQEGDMIVCFAEHRVGIFQRPLSQVLESSLRAPVYILTGLSTRNRPRSGLLSQIAVWSGSAAILGGAALLQVRIISMPKDWAQTTLLIISVILEAWLLWVWNGLFG